MKNAYVLHHHLGDDGNVVEGMILTEISDKRFAALEKRGLVREATPKEVKEGYRPEFAKDRSAEQVADAAALATRDADIAKLKAEHESVVKGLTERAETAETALAESKAEVERLTGEVATRTAASGDGEPATVDGAKAAEPPANKKAADPANKGA